MQCSVHAHVAIASVPVEFCLNTVAKLWSCGIFGNDVSDCAAFGVTRVDNTGTATVPANGSGVTGLTTAHGIKNGSIENDCIVVNGRYDGIACFLIGVVSEQVFGHSCLARIIIQIEGMAPKPC